MFGNKIKNIKIYIILRRDKNRFRLLNECMVVWMVDCIPRFTVFHYDNRHCHRPHHRYQYQYHNHLERSNRKQRGTSWIPWGTLSWWRGRCRAASRSSCISLQGVEKFRSVPFDNDNLGRVDAYHYRILKPSYWGGLSTSMGAITFYRFTQWCIYKLFMKSLFYY